jgi:hypothetical protein
MLVGAGCFTRSKSEMVKSAKTQAEEALSATANTREATRRPDRLWRAPEGMALLCPAMEFRGVFL